jgi:hypothetical protein
MELFDIIIIACSRCALEGQIYLLWTLEACQGTPGQGLVCQLGHIYCESWRFIEVPGLPKSSFRLLSEIQISSPESWESSIFLTFDVDWATDDVLRDSLAILEQSEVRATWFFTHESPMIAELIDKGHEVGVHPNFNSILAGTDSRDVQSVVDDCLSWCPEAISSRSHSLVYGSPIAAALSRGMIRYSSNLTIPVSSGVKIFPWSNASGLIEVPYSWADEFSWHNVDQPSILEWLKFPGLLVADFHPIHVFLNSASAELYDSSRKFHRNREALETFRNVGRGARTELFDLCGVAG